MSENNETKNPWTTLSSREVYENPWIRVREDQVRRPDGSPGIYGRVHFKNLAIGVIPIDHEGHVYLVGQYRYVLNRYSWEIPEGGCPEGEDPLAAAKRELAEETGLQALDWRLLGEADLSNSVTDEHALWFLATNLIEGEPRPDGSEVLAQRKVLFEEALEMIERREIQDALSILGLLHYARVRVAHPSSRT